MSPRRQSQRARLCLHFLRQVPVPLCLFQCPLFWLACTPVLLRTPLTCVCVLSSDSPMLGEHICARSMSTTTQHDKKTTRLKVVLGRHGCPVSGDFSLGLDDIDRSFFFEFCTPPLFVCLPWLPRQRWPLGAWSIELLCCFTPKPVNRA